MSDVARPAVEQVSLDELRPHPQNYRTHPLAQLEHLEASLREHGVYRNLVVARDGTILAGHGVYAAARRIGVETIGVIRLDVGPDDPQAIKILTGDNEVGRTAIVDDRMLAEHLRTLADLGDLLGTGFDEQMLADLTRWTSGLDAPPIDAADAWAGMPEFDQPDRQSVFHTVVHFATEQDADRFFALIGVARASSLWWPKPDGLVGSNASEQWIADE